MRGIRVMSVSFALAGTSKTIHARFEAPAESGLCVHHKGRGSICL